MVLIEKIPHIIVIWRFSCTSGILCGIGGLAASILILAGGRSLIHGGTFADGLREFWNWAIAAMAGVSCGYSYWYNQAKKKDNDDQGKQ